MEQQLSTTTAQTNGTAQTTEKEKFNKFAVAFGDYDKKLKEFVPVPVRLTIEQVSMLYIKDVKDASFNYAERIIMKAQKMMNDLQIEVVSDNYRESRGEPRSTSIEMIENNLKEIERLYYYLEGTDSFMVKYRKFIREKLVNPAITLTDKINPEKWDSFIEVKSALLNLKTKDKANQDLLRNKELEKNQLIAHIENYNSQAKQEFKDDVLKEVSTMKQSYLKGLVENPEIEPIKEAIKEIKIKEYAGYKGVVGGNTRLITVHGVEHKTEFLIADEVESIVSKYQLPPIEKFWEAANAIIDHAFADYKEQLAIVKAQPQDKQLEKIQEATKDIETAREKIKQDAATEQAVNTFKSTAVSVPELKPTYKPLKGYYTIKIDETTNDSQSFGDCFEDRLLSVWLSNPILKTFASSIKSAINRTDKQRIDAICAYAKETGNLFPEFEYTYNEK